MRRSGIDKGGLNDIFGSYREHLEAGGKRLVQRGKVFLQRGICIEGFALSLLLIVVLTSFPHIQKYYFSSKSFSKIDLNVCKILFPFDDDEEGLI